MPNICANDKTDEVILFVLTILLTVWKHYGIRVHQNIFVRADV